MDFVFVMRGLLGGAVAGCEGNEAHLTEVRCECKKEKWHYMILFRLFLVLLGMSCPWSSLLTLIIGNVHCFQSAFDRDLSFSRNLTMPH
jgi:hypothetical protein